MNDWVYRDYQPQSLPEADLVLMQPIDQIHLDKPYLGSRRMVDTLTEQGHETGHQHTQPLMRLMGIEAIHPDPKTSKPHPHHRIYPYLLRGLKINRANQVWASDVIYLPISRASLSDSHHGLV